LLSGAYKNSGDFLIVQRSKELLKYVYPDLEITEYERRLDLSDKLNEINKSDCLILAGGPAYVEHVYPTIPLFSHLDEIKIPIFALGLGWRGNFHNNKYNYKFTENMLKIFKKINENFLLGCRDLNSVDVLRNNGIQNSIMTGCPAWYHIPSMNENRISTEVKKICISDPADVKNMDTALNLIKWLKLHYPNVNIQFIFHRGTTQDQFTGEVQANHLKRLVKEVEAIDIKWIDISYGSEGFKIYDDCDLHIGFRVHAHIYMLSQRRATLLIEEDFRGDGVNKALGLRSIRANGENENYILKEVEDWIYYIENIGKLEFELAFSKMRYYFEHMIYHIKTIGEVMKNP